MAGAAGMLMVIPAADRGLRMDTSPDAPPKCLAVIGGATLLDRLVCAAAGRVCRCRLVVPPGNRYFTAWLEKHDGGPPCELIEEPPGPYGRTILRTVHDEQSVLVVDSDIVVQDGALERFIDVVVTRGWPHPLTVGLSADPWSLGLRTTCWSVDGGVPLIGRGFSRPLARLTGICHFGATGLAALRRFDGRGGGSFAGFLASLPGTEVTGVDVGFNFDCNTPDDLDQARRRVDQMSGGEAAPAGSADDGACLSRAGALDAVAGHVMQRRQGILSVSTGILAERNKLCACVVGGGCSGRTC